MKEIVINSKLILPSDAYTIGELFEVVYRTRRFARWFNFVPFVWMLFDKERLEVGCSGRLFFSLPPFTYQLTVTEVVHNAHIQFHSQSKHFFGKADMHFYVEGDFIVYEEPHVLKATNFFIYYYYKWLLAGHHDRYMQFRFKSLVKQIHQMRGEVLNEDNL